MDHREGSQEILKSGSPQKCSDWTLSPVDCSPDLVLSSDLLMVQSKSGLWQGCRTNNGIKKARGQAKINHRVYYEVHFVEQGYAGVGWSMSQASLDLGADKFGWGYMSTAKKSNCKQSTDYGEPFGEKFDIVGCILDLRSGEIRFTVNGRNMGKAFDLPLEQLEVGVVYPTICIKDANCQVRLSASHADDDHKPDDCIWIDELDMSLAVKEKSDKTTKVSSRPSALISEPREELATPYRGSTYAGHVSQLKSLVDKLAELESKAQTNYISLYL